MDQFWADNTLADWYDIADFSGLDERDIMTVVPPSVEQVTIASDDGFIFEDSSTRVLDVSEIAALSDTDLRYTINEIYARHGYIFSDQALLEYFRQFDWYQETVPKEGFNDSMLNAIELENIRLLSDERDRR